MNIEKGTIVTDIAHVGRYEVLGIFLVGNEKQVKIKLRRISERKILTEDEEGILRVSVEVYKNSFVEVKDYTNNNKVGERPVVSTSFLTEKKETTIMSSLSTTNSHYQIDNNSNWGCILPTIVLVTAVILPFIYLPLGIISILIFASFIKHMLGGNNKHR